MGSPSPDHIEPVVWVKQEETFYCGPAVAQMLIAADGGSCPTVPPTWQDRLWDDIKAQTHARRPAMAPKSKSSFPTQKCEKCKGDPDWHCWSSEPTALANAVNLHVKTSYALEVSATEFAATAALLDSIDGHQAATALVRGWQHWLVVHGYAEGSWVSYKIAGRDIEGVYIRDPNEHPGLHFVRSKKWFDDYLSSVPCGAYAGKYVVIVKPPTMPTKPSRRKASPTDTHGPLIEPAAATREAEAAARQLTERHPSQWEVALASTSPRAPLLVRRLDREGSFYYIVPFGRKERETARLIVDARTSEFSEAIGVELGDAALPPFVDLALPAESWLSRLRDLPALRGRDIRPERLKLPPQIPVWMPCDQSTSPFLPFYEISVEGQSVYLRLDGQPFDSLTAALA